MSTRARRALAAEPAGHPAFSSFTTVVDLDPALTLEEALPSHKALQCASCNFATFLRGVEHVEAFDGLSALSATFRELPRLLSAFRAGDSEALHELSRSLGAPRCYEIVPAHAAPSTRLPRVYLTEDVHVPTGLGEQDFVLVPLSAALKKGRHAAALIRPHANVLIGYVEHARAIEEYADAMENGSLEAWVDLVFDLTRRGVSRLGLIAAVTPCASLRWQANTPLEGLRARLDLAFRRVDADASLMCAENVSGYSLSNDLERVPKQVIPALATRAIRVDRLLFVVTP